MIIRAFQEKDASELSEIIYRVISQLEKNNPQLNYRKVKEEDTPEELLKTSQAGKMWVAEEMGKIVGTISLQGKRVRRYFVDPQHQGRGIGRELMNTLKAYAKNNNQKSIWAGAIISACPVYKKLGFTEGRTFFNKEINQEEMEMKLDLEK